MDTVIVESVGGEWHVLPHNQPVERFDTLEKALARARDIALNTTETEWSVLVKPSHGSP